MPDQSQPHQPQPLRPLKRFITDHDAQGRAVFNTSVGEDLPGEAISNGDRFLLGYATKEKPVDLSRDLAAYAGYLADPPGITIPAGTVLRVVDIRPGGRSPMHRTVSLDYGVVLEGEVELVLDSGETRLMRRGDMSVQRGTMHMWVNTSATEWARMLYVLQAATAVEVEVDGERRALGEDYGDVTGLKASADS